MLTSQLGYTARRQEATERLITQHSSVSFKLKKSEATSQTVSRKILSLR